MKTRSLVEYLFRGQLLLSLGSNSLFPLHFALLGVKHLICSANTAEWQVVFLPQGHSELGPAMAGPLSTAEVQQAEICPNSSLELIVGLHLVSPLLKCDE